MCSPWGHKESERLSDFHLRLREKRPVQDSVPLSLSSETSRNLRRGGWEELGLLSPKAEISFYTAEPSKRRFSKVSLRTEFPETPLWEREGRREARWPLGPQQQRARATMEETAGCSACPGLGPRGHCSPRQAGVLADA